MKFSILNRYFSIKYLMVLATLMGSFLTITQAQEVNLNTLQVHLNKQVFIGGSQLKYAVYLPTNNVGIKKTVYFELVGTQNQQRIHWKSQTRSNILSGEFPIPDTLPSGFYILFVYTNERYSNIKKYSQNMPVLIQQINEEPLSHLTAPKTNSMNDSISNPFFSPVKPWVNVTQSTDSLLTGLKRIANCQIGLPNTIESAQLSVSITEISPFDSLLSSYQVYNCEPYIYPDFYCFEPELNFISLSGKITDSLQKPLIKQPVYLSANATKSSFNYSLTDEKGRFCFVIDSTWDQKEILLQVGGTQTLSFVHWHIDQKNFSRVGTDTQEYFLNEKQFNYLNQLQKRELVHRIFYPDSVPKVTLNEKPVPENIFFEPKYIIYPSDFEFLPNFKELADNILTAVRFKTDGQEYKMGIVTNNQVNFDNVLVFLNGNPISEMQTLAKLSSKDIQRVEVFNSSFMYGELSFQGVVSIFTHSIKFNPADFNKNSCNQFHSIHNQRYFYPQKGSNQPNLLPDIYWDQELTVSKDTPASIRLTNVDMGKPYMVTLKGFTSSGEFIHFRKLINF